MSSTMKRISRRWVAAAAVGGAAVTSAALVHPAWSAPTATPTSGSFTVVAHHGSETRIDLGTSGFGAGDEDLMTSPVTFHGKPAGRMIGNCTNARVTSNGVDQLCEFSLRLRHGQLTASGSVHAGQDGPGTFSLPILGGTGRYVGAGGALTITAGSGASIPLTVTLTR